MHIACGYSIRIKKKKKICLSKMAIVYPTPNSADTRNSRDLL